MPWDCNQMAARASKICVAEAEEIGPVSSLVPDQTHLPSIYAMRMSLGERYDKKTEFRMARARKAP